MRYRRRDVRSDQDFCTRRGSASVDVRLTPPGSVAWPRVLAVRRGWLVDLLRPQIVARCARAWLSSVILARVHKSEFRSSVCRLPVVSSVDGVRGGRVTLVTSPHCG